MKNVEVEGNSLAVNFARESRSHAMLLVVDKETMFVCFLLLSQIR